MSMVVQHNLTAMNSNRMLGVTSGAQAKSTEKLSSGYKINRAADDASGLAISEKMRKQIRGLTQASTNAQDGISAVQTAEGALAEVHDMLQRMNELAVKAANGTNSVSDRDSIQAEIDQLTTEIDRVAETTKFNETYLLKGDRNAVRGYSYNYSTVLATGVAPATSEFDVDAATGLSVKITFATPAPTGPSGKVQNEIVNALKTSGINVSATLSTDKRDSANTGKQELVYKVSLSGAVADKYTVAATGTTGKNFIIMDASGTTIAQITVGGIDVDTTTGTSGKADGVYNSNFVAKTYTAAYAEGESYTFHDKDGNKIAPNDLNNYFTTRMGATGATSAARTDATTVYDAVGNKIDLASMPARIRANQDIQGKLQIGLHVGADATTNNQITMNIEAMSAKALGVVGLKVDGENDTNALNAIDTIKAAISKVSAQRSDLGAIQNRLEHTIKNLDNVVENTTAAESQIRDTDMATEMVNYSKNNILAQAGQSMLAQANQSNQGVLSLLG